MGHDDKKYPLERILDTADLASLLKPDALPQLQQALRDQDSAVRYWAALGILMRGQKAVASSRGELRQALADASPSVRIAAAEALGKFGDAEDANKALATLLELTPLTKNRVYVSVLALNTLDELGKKAAPGLQVIESAGKTDKPLPPRMDTYVPRLVERIVAEIKR